MRVARGLRAVEAGYRQLLAQVVEHAPADPDPFGDGPGLRHDARARATMLGHALHRFATKDGGRAVAYCARCKQLVIVNAAEGRSYGPAVTHRCPHGGSTT